ncbi:MAG: B12-binding domain-containing radical SAM protein, partial [Magnetococcales bacterium]|nr:B12-binding domain-containing radical SAM protein [Magnetococcales bacterium]
GIRFKDGGKIVHTPERPLLEVESLLPVPWDLVNPEDYIHSDLYLKNSPRTLDIGQTSRGCPFNCGFCVSASIRQRRWRAFSVERSLDHIISSVRRFNLSGFWLRDDEFYIKRSRTDEICRGMIQEKLNVIWYTSGTRIDIFNKSSDESLRLLEESGATVLKMGAESGSDRILQLMGKGIRREDTIRANQRIRHTNLIPAYALMVGFPTETWDEIHQTLDLARQLKEDNPKAQFESLAIYTPMPGTPLWSMAQEHGLVPPQSLEEWIQWNVEDRDVDGKKSPWYNYRDRMALCNVSTMFTTLNAVRNVVAGVDNIFLRPLMQAAAFLVFTDFNYRLRKRYYHRVPEAMILEKVRDLLFRSDISVIR